MPLRLVSLHFAMLLFSLPSVAADTLVAQSLLSEQAFWTTGAALNAGTDLLLVGAGGEQPGAILLRVSHGRLTDQTPLSVPEGFQYFANTAANVPDGLLFTGIDFAGNTLLFETDGAGREVTRVGRPHGIHMASVFAFGSELWIAGQSDHKLPIVGRINQLLEVEHIVTLPQQGNSLTRKIIKQGETYFALTQAIGPSDETYVWKLAPSGEVIAKQRILGIGATFSLNDNGIAVSYNKDRIPTVDFLNFDLKTQWSIGVLTPRGTGEVTNLLAVNDQWILVGGDNDRTYAARLSSTGQLLGVTYDENTPPRKSMKGYVLHASHGVLWIVGSNIDVKLHGPRNNNIFSYTVELNTP